METREIIEALGGRQRVAAATGSDPNTVFHWIKRGGIPPRHIKVLLHLAAEVGRSDITLDALTPGDEQLPSGEAAA